MGLKKIKLGGNSSQPTFSKSLLVKQEPEIKTCEITYNESPNLITTVSTGFTHNDKPVIAPILPEYQQHPSKIENQDSIIESVDTGFGENNELIKDCPKTEYKAPLYKDNFLTEFKSEEELKLVRTHLGVYGKPEIDQIVNNMVESNQSFVQKIEHKIANLDLMKSSLKAYADYEIPDKLFKI